VLLIHPLGYPLRLTVDAREGEKPDELLARLQAKGYRPPWQPWPTSPDGMPICSKHQAVMVAWEKQGDTWYSHRVVTVQGEELYCRGFAYGPAEKDGFYHAGAAQSSPSR
jgi:hypothetical protein